MKLLLEWENWTNSLRAVKASQGELVLLGKTNPDPVGARGIRSAAFELEESRIVSHVTLPVSRTVRECKRRASGRELVEAVVHRRIWIVGRVRKSRTKDSLRIRAEKGIELLESIVSRTRSDMLVSHSEHVRQFVEWTTQNWKVIKQEREILRHRSLSGQAR